MNKQSKTNYSKDRIVPIFNGIKDNLSNDFRSAFFMWLFQFHNECWCNSDENQDMHKKCWINSMKTANEIKREIGEERTENTRQRSCVLLMSMCDCLMHSYGEFAQ